MTVDLGEWAAVLHVGNLDATSRTTSTASRVLPQPPKPVSVTTRALTRRSPTFTRSRSRPIDDATPTGSSLRVLTDQAIRVLIKCVRPRTPTRRLTTPAVKDGREAVRVLMSERISAAFVATCPGIRFARLEADALTATASMLLSLGAWIF